MEVIGVILVNLGGPDSIKAVKPFLYNLFSDRNIIKLGPRFLQKPLAYMISTFRSKKTEQMYSLIGGKSPIMDITAAQAKALEEALRFKIQNSKLEIVFKVYMGMRYWKPFIDDVVPEIYEYGIRKVIALSMYPQYSNTTTGSSFLKLKEVLKGYPLEISYVSSWWNHPLYIDALVDLIKKGMSLFNHPSDKGKIDYRDIHVLFSAHSLPKKVIEDGDPYVDQIMGTISEINKVFPITWHLSYQSKTGPIKWLEPSTDEKIIELAKRGVRNILIVPISFVSDHIETLYEIDILYSKLARELGVTLNRIQSLNDHPVFIEALTDIVKNASKKKGWI